MSIRGPATIDFETTDKDAKIAHPVEFAIYTDDATFVEFIKPPIPIPAETSAVHHIVDDDVRYSRSWEQVKPDIRNIVDAMDCKILVAHNAEYEQNILKEGFEDVQWVCTYKCALVIWPDAPAHKNEVLRYWLNLPDLGRKFGQIAHSALHDCKVTHQILGRMLELHSIEELILWSSQPKKFPKIPFGKHAGMKWEAIPGDYLGWICKQVDMDKDIIYCARLELDRRRMANATPGPR